MAEDASRRVAERTAELMQERTLLRILVDNIPDYIYVKDEEGRYLLANRAYLLSLRLYAPEDLLGKSDYDVYPKTMADYFHNADLDALRSLQPVMGVEELRPGLGGGDIWVSATKVPLIGAAGTPIGILGIAHDITTRKRMEDELRRALQTEQELSELKSRFVSIASHEFRTPLATILASTETLRNYRKQLTDEKIEARLDKIRTQVRHMTEIMEDVLMLARGQAGKIVFKPEPTDIVALLQEVLRDLLGTGEREPQHQLVTEISCVPDQQVAIDRGLFRKAVTNLLTNALKYSPSGSRVEVILTCDPPDNAKTAVLIVRDSGIGIPEEDQKYIFEPFHRGRNVGAISGTGLGLVVAKQSIELHGGSIRFSSSTGIGTTFVMRLPIAAENEQSNYKTVTGTE
ncbi:MAG: PAS domain-containing sensor histidine kinase [Anaerolineae bacterium]|nr:PAS domain-containing sensor histidine kinase [Anaerolineae bacterium]